MATNKKHPDDFPVWDGNQNSKLHAYRPGNSQSVSIKQIVDAAVSLSDHTADIEASNTLAQQAKDRVTIVAEDLNKLDDRVAVLESKPEAGTAKLPGRYELGSYCIARDVVGTRTGDYYEASAGTGITMMALDGTAGVAPGVGTWRQMSWKVNGGTNYIARSTIWMRIA